MKRFWTRRRTRFVLSGAVTAVFLAVGASIGAAAIGGFSPLAAPGKLASGAQNLVAPSSSSAQEQQYPQGKTTICHRTGSQSNPYVMITVSNRALPAHAKHGDIIPAPAGGCPTTASPTTTSSAQDTQQAPRTKAKHAAVKSKARKAKKTKQGRAAHTAHSSHRTAKTSKQKQTTSHGRSSHHQKQTNTKQKKAHPTRGSHGNSGSAHTKTTTPAPSTHGKSTTGQGQSAQPHGNGNGQSHATQTHGSAGGTGQGHGKKK